jgi:hypothetical protein
VKGNPIYILCQFQAFDFSHLYLKLKANKTLLPIISFQKQALDLCLRVMLSFKTNEIDDAVKSLDQPEVDMLMKYIYRGFENANGANAKLLTWHEKVC